VKYTKTLILLAALISTNAFADGFSASVGADYSKGDYGTSDSTKVFYVPFTATYETGAFTYSVTVPWIRVSGNGTVVPGGFGGSGGAGDAGGIDCRKRGTGACTNVATPATTTTTTTRSSESGLGDIIAGATYNAFDGGDNGFVVDLSGRIKFGTASDTRGLGSGKNDYAVQANVDKNFNGPYASAGLGYKWLGEPSGVSYKNVIFGSLGGGYKYSKDTTVGVSYDWATAAVGGADRPQEVSIYASHRINDQYKLGGWLYAGVSDASPDFGGGAKLSYYF
jgi:hypothetical protein